MTPRTAFIEGIRGIAEDQARLLVEERKLMDRKRKLADRMRDAIAALSEFDASGRADSKAIGVDAEFAPRVPGADKGKAEYGPAIAARRRYMSAVIEACRSVMLAVGHPLTIGEVMAVHPERARMSLHAIGHALDLRTRGSEPEFVGMRGCYWVSDRPLPEGWKHPKGCDWTVDEASVARGERTRVRRQRLIDSAEAKLTRKAGMLEEGWVPLRRERRPGAAKNPATKKVPVAKVSGLGPRFNIKGLMENLNRIRAAKGEPVVHFEAWPETREQAQAYIDEVRAFRVA